MADLRKKLQHAIDATDDWTKTQDQKLRKRIQNRLAQRKRRSAAVHTKKTSKTSLKYSSETILNDDNDGDLPFDNKLESVVLVQTNKSRLFEEVIEQYVSTYGLHEHKFFGLPQYSSMRAVVLNIELLGLTPNLLENDDAISPWTMINPFVERSRSIHTLTPTVTQLCTYHHPFIDVIASPLLRDNMLDAGLTDEQEEMFCMDMHRDGFRIWGSQPWNMFGWEASQEFVDKWGWLLDPQTIQHSNFWRFERGEPELNWRITEVD